MTALFAVRRRGQTSLYFGRHMGHLALVVFARGPTYATTIVTDLPRVAEPTRTVAGFVIDHDVRRAMLFDAGVRWDPAEAELEFLEPGALARAGGLAELDLLPEEACLADVMRVGSSAAQWFEALAAVPLADNWSGWALEWTTSAAVVEELAPPKAGRS